MSKSFETNETCKMFGVVYALANFPVKNIFACWAKKYYCPKSPILKFLFDT